MLGGTQTLILRREHVGSAGNKTIGDNVRRQTKTEAATDQKAHQYSPIAWAISCSDHIVPFRVAWMGQATMGWD